MFFPSERPLAKLTPMWRFASMDTHMIRQMLLTSKWLGAEVASVWRFACVLTHVIGQMFLPREGFGAILALVRWLTRVLPDVVHQVILPRKCFRTVWTAEGRLPCTYFTSEFAMFQKKNVFPSFRTQWSYPAQGEFCLTQRNRGGRNIEWDGNQGRNFDTIQKLKCISHMKFISKLIYILLLKFNNKDHLCRRSIKNHVVLFSFILFYK